LADSGRDGVLETKQNEDVKTSQAVMESRQKGRSQPLRVLVVTNMFPTPEEPWFGSFVRDQVEDLRGLGINLRVVSFDGRQQVLNYARAAREVRRIVLREAFDVVHAHYGLTGAVIALQRRVPGVTTFHGSDYTGAVWWHRYVSWVVARRSCPVVVSEQGRRSLSCPAAVVIPSGVDIDLFKPADRQDARHQLGWGEEGPYVLLPGSRSNPTKGADLFDEVVTELQKVVPGVEGVALEGFSREQTALVMNAVDVTLMTSEREGSPVTVRESLACLTPVVSVAVGDVPQVIADLPGCGIFPRHARALARGVIDALAVERHPNLRRRAESTSRRQVAERIAALYAVVAGSHRR
jgi:glycosyltransferase involved in cell wall biosynthesis